MQTSARYRNLWCLTLGILLVWASSLFFAANFGWHILLFFAGLVIAFVSFVSVMVKHTNRIRLAATLATLTAAFLFISLQAYIIAASFDLHLWQHEDALEQTVEMLEDVELTRWVGPNRPCEDDAPFDQNDCQTVHAFMEKGDALRAWKEQDGIALEIFGFLDNRWGYFYCTASDPNQCAASNRVHMKHEWYRYWAE